MTRRLSNTFALMGVLLTAFVFLRNPEPGSLAALLAAVVMFLESLRPAPTEGAFNSRLLVHAAQLARPLLALLILWVLYRAFLGLSVFGRLGSTQTFLLLCLFLVLTFLLVAQVLTPPRHRGSSRSKSMQSLSNTPPPPSDSAAPGPPPPLREPAKPKRPARPRQARLKLVKLRVIDGVHEVRTFRKRELKSSDEDLEKEGRFPLVCLEVQNVGRDSLMIRRLEMDVRRLRSQWVRGSTEVVEWEHSVLISQEKESDHPKIELKCEVSPGESSGLVFVIGHQLGYGHYDSIEYMISLRLCFGDDQVLDLRNHRIEVCCPWNFCPPDPLPVRVLGSGACTG